MQRKGGGSAKKNKKKKKKKKKEKKRKDKVKEISLKIIYTPQKTKTKIMNMFVLIGSIIRKQEILKQSFRDIIILAELPRWDRRMSSCQHNENATHRPMEEHTTIIIRNS